MVVTFSMGSGTLATMIYEVDCEPRYRVLLWGKDGDDITGVNFAVGATDVGYVELSCVARCVSCLAVFVLWILEI